MYTYKNAIKRKTEKVKCCVSTLNELMVGLTAIPLHMLEVSIHFFHKASLLSPSHIFDEK